MPGSVEQNKAIVKEFMERYWGNGDATAVDDLCSDDFFMDYPLVPQIKGKEAAKQAIKGLHSLFSDFSFEGVGPLIAENVPEGQSYQLHEGEYLKSGEFVATKIKGSGKHTGGAVPGFFVGDLPEATGKSIDITGMSIFKLKDGKIVEEVGEEGALTALQQLGLVNKV